MQKRYKKSLVNFHNDRRAEATKIEACQKENTHKYNDGLTTLERREKRIDDAANGCWWVKSYIVGSITFKRNMSGIDDE